MDGRCESGDDLRRAQLEVADRYLHAGAVLARRRRAQEREGRHRETAERAVHAGEPLSGKGMGMCKGKGRGKGNGNGM